MVPLNVGGEAEDVEDQHVRVADRSSGVVLMFACEASSHRVDGLQSNSGIFVDGPLSTVMQTSRAMWKCALCPWELARLRTFLGMVERIGKCLTRLGLWRGASRARTVVVQRLADLNNVARGTRSERGTSAS
jgi:hypothetical protein